jgi:hypothetical protein
MSLNHKADKEDVNAQFAYHAKLNSEYIKQLQEDLSRKEKFNVYNQRLVGEIMEFLISKKIMTNQEAFLLTAKAKSAIFTKQELYELQKIANKQMQEANQ